MKKRIVSAVCIALLLTVAVYAVEVPDLGRTGSISIRMTCQNQPVPGGSLTLYRVAEVHVENGGDYSFRYGADYENCRISLDDLSAAETAQALADFTASGRIQGTGAKIDEQGRVSFEKLEPGLYLLVQTEAAAGYNAAAPFLVSVPGREDGSYVYDVDASPKLELEPESTTQTTTAPTKPTDPTGPETGQTLWPVPVMASSGVMLLLLGWCLIAPGKNKTE